MGIAVLGGGEADEFGSRIAWLELTGDFDDMPNVRNLGVNLDPTQTVDPLPAQFAPVVDPLGNLANRLLQLPEDF